MWWAAGTTSPNGTAPTSGCMATTPTPAPGASGRSEGNVLKVWSLDAAGAPTLVGSVTVPDIGTVSDVQVSEDGQLLVLSGERGPDGGIFLYSLSDPAAPSFLGSALVGEAGSTPSRSSTINGRLLRLRGPEPGLHRTSRGPGAPDLRCDRSGSARPWCYGSRSPSATTASTTPSSGMASRSSSSGIRSRHLRCG